jgi:GNAT superfamily N-acetyltransferase
VQLRPANAADAAGIARVQERGWQRAYRHVFPPSRLDAGGFINVERWRTRLERPPPGWATFVAVESSVVGFASVGPSRDGHGGGEVYAIYVDPDAWGTGSGRALLERAEKRLARDYDEAVLWVLEDNPRARRFYEIAGWTPDGGRKEDVWFDVTAKEVRYRKRLRTSRSRS